ncbi:hypothetical protein SSPO_087500 [Streptomyces antimycoticus]|uniref:Uncharacterized protein n=1 Tax=Streptomyces antimycoticus TaxID=68175 RepID=A0A499UXW9_9ACTN|nr:hypothetical protein [Streptomyces antimycoticus]BBJ46032.1 hypothetical protein SSPO_087500 [Streptomyces antimycoticus]
MPMPVKAGFETVPRMMLVLVAAGSVIHTVDPGGSGDPTVRGAIRTGEVPA